MDLGSPWAIISGLFIGLVGLVLLNYGRTELNLRVALAGVAMCIYPYFVSSLLLTWLAFFAIGGGLWAWQRHSPD